MIGRDGNKRLSLSEVRDVLIDHSNMIRSDRNLSSEQATGFPPAQKIEQRSVRDEVDEQLLPILLEEAHELYPKIRSTLTAWREQCGADARLSNQLQRCLHTFKGSARMAGAMRLGELAHRVEGRIAGAVKQADFNDALWSELESQLDRIGAVIEELAVGEVVTDATQDADVLYRERRQEANGGRVHFSSVSDRLYRVARQTAKELGKRVNLELIGGEIEMDGEVLEKLTAPFEHLLRNAIAHGIESPAQRQQSGKTPIGEICLSLSREDDGLVFKFSDDGLGLDMVRLKQKGIEHGMLKEDEEIDQARAVQMIFRPGLSTAQEVTEIAGRGIGLDVVSSEIGALGGSLDVHSTPGKGLNFIIRLPAH
jgi:chemotaxis protein histidine kinase CheA